MSNAKLQRLIDRTVKANNDFQRAQSVLMEECLKRYGHEPGDVDCDAIIDSVLGGCGVSDGMSAEDFDREMSAAVSRKRP
jgi:2C-methyl-D-erythritol 2,4-cyclodiphosphate synthase